jgi:glycosyltransferase involved in cell wall biosynthesis
VLKHYPEATLDILGQGSQHAELETYVLEHQLTGVTFLGQVPNQQIYDYLAKADIMLSAPKIDNMPVSLLEAMNAGLLVISSRVGGVPYMINDGLGFSGAENSSAETTASSLIASSPYRPNKATGLLFESGNADELAEKMLWALEYPKEVQTITTNAQAEVQKYAWENVKQQLMKVYE